MSETQEAELLAESKRGKWIISRALCALESQLDAKKGVEDREVSDLEDVRSLIRAYPSFKATQQAAKVVAESGTPDWLNDL